MDSIKSQLVDMGFNESKIKRAIESCPEAKTLEQVMEWILAHEDELTSDFSSKDSNNVAVASDPKTDGESSNLPADQQPGGPNESASNMAARKKITVEEAQRIITERQLKRAEEERKKAIEDEKRRRLDGQKMAATRAELQDQERIRLAQQIRREKLETEAHRKRLLEQIARDREAMKRKNNPSEEAPSSSTTTPSKDIKPTPPRAPASECKLALRFPDGSNKIQKFSPQEPLAAVRVFVQMERPQTNCSIEFVAPPNKKLTESMMENTLESLGLCPASRLEVKFSQSEWSDLD